jgi:F-type H+-transporting ATPase subunit delta
MLSATATKYASALADVVFEQGVSERVRDELAGFLEWMTDHEELRETLASPALPLDVKQNIVREIADRSGSHRSVLNFLLVLLERNRIGQLTEIMDAYDWVLDERAGIVRVDVLSAYPLGPAMKKRLEETMIQVTRKQVKLAYQIDESLIAGLKLQVGSTVFDGTIQTELDQLRRQLEV